MEAHARTFLRWAQTPAGTSSIFYCCSYVCLGLSLSSLGPVLLDLSVQTGASLRATGYCFVIRSAGYLAGAACGPLFDRVPGHRVLGVAMLLVAGGTFGITRATSTAALAFTVSLQGVAMGLLDTGCNLLLLWWLGAGAGPVMQVSLSASGLGARLFRLLTHTAPPP